jgi:ER protein Pkr1
LFLNLPPVTFITGALIGLYSVIVMMDEPADRHVGVGGENTSQRGPRRSESPSAAAADIQADSDFLSNILAPGSSLNPAFLLVVDVVLASLSLTLGSLAIVTGGNVHLIALLFITLALWVSIKW